MSLILYELSHNNYLNLKKLLEKGDLVLFPVANCLIMMENWRRLLRLKKLITEKERSFCLEREKSKRVRKVGFLSLLSFPFLSFPYLSPPKHLTKQRNNRASFHKPRFNSFRNLPNERNRASKRGQLTGGLSRPCLSNNGTCRRRRTLVSIEWFFGFNPKNSLFWEGFSGWIY